MDNLKIHCSSLGKIMGTPRKKGEKLTQTTKTYIEGLVKEIVFNYKSEISSKYLDKGNAVENESIDLYNQVFFTNHKKHEGRVSNEYLTGECDIKTPVKVIDIKSSWSSETFPATPDDGINKDYEWQLRGYMMLYDLDFADLAYCLVDTPEHLLEWENNLSIHEVSDIDPELRVTVLLFERDLEMEKLIIEKVLEAREYAKNYEQKIIDKNK